MITEQDLQAAIAECEGQRNPNANTCIKLAAFYTIRDHLFPREQEQVPTLPVMYSQAAEPSVIVEKPKIESDTNFAKVANGIDGEKLLAVMDELMSTVQVLHPRLYDGVMRKLKN